MRRADQLAMLKQGPPDCESTHPENRVEGVGLGEKITKESSHLSLSMY